MANPFDESLIEKLEVYVKDQVRSGDYDFAANKALLKLYDSFPAKRNEHISALIVTKVRIYSSSVEWLKCMGLNGSKVAQI